MGIEESMIEDGFHDEEEYLEHLLDEADDFFRRQQEERNSYQEESFSYQKGNEKIDSHEYSTRSELENQYYKWRNENPLGNKLFITWVNLDFDWDKKVTYPFLEKFEWWKRNEGDPNIQTAAIRASYGDFFSRIVEYFKWQLENPIEDMLRLPYVEQYSGGYPFTKKIPERELLVDRVYKFEDWIKYKKTYDKLFNNASDEKKKEFIEYVNEVEFQNDTSFNHVKECLIEFIDLNIGYCNINANEVMVWYVEDEERGRDLFYRIQCIHTFISQPQLLL